jgi:hypothetical protein
VLAFTAPVFLATQRWPVIDSTVLMTAATVMAIVLGAGLARWIPWLAATTGQDARDIAPRAACALAVLAWGPLMAIQLGNIHRLENLMLVAGSGTGISLLGLLQIAVVALATIMSGIILLRVRAGFALAAIWALFGVAFVALVITG